MLLGDILKDRIEMFNKNPKTAVLQISSDYTKKWNRGVEFFHLEINKDRKKQGLKELPFIVVRSKLLALKEIDDLRWFYYHCKKYAGTKNKQGQQNTFSKCFFGALRVK